MAKQRTNVSEEQMLKALGQLEEHDVAKGHIPEQMKSTKAANGGLAPIAGKDEDAEHLETGALDGTQPMAKGDTDDDDDDDDDDESAMSDESDEDDEDSETMKKTPMKKSTRAAMEDNDNIRKGVEVSPFLESLTDVVADSMDRMAKSLADGQSNQMVFNQKLQKAIVQMGNMTMDLARRLESFSNAPASVRKSVLQKSEIVERHLGGEDPDDTQFSKSDVLTALTDLAMKGAIPSAVVSSYESTDWMDPQSAKLVESHLRKSLAE